MEQPTSLGPGHHGEHKSHLHTRKVKKTFASVSDACSPHIRSLRLRLRLLKTDRHTLSNFCNKAETTQGWWFVLGLHVDINILCTQVGPLKALGQLIIGGLVVRILGVGVFLATVTSCTTSIKKEPFCIICPLSRSSGHP